jgi:hypothetical protein
MPGASSVRVNDTVTRRPVRPNDVWNAHRKARPPAAKPVAMTTGQSGEKLSAQARH